MTDLRERLDRDLADLRLPTGFEESVLTRGRRLRTRRRWARLAGGLTVVVAATALSVTALGGDTASTGSGFATDAPPPATSEPPATRPPGWWNMPARRMLTTLKGALPDGVRVAEVELTSDGVDGPTRAIGALTGVLDARTGPGRFQILLYPPQPDPATAAEQGGETPFLERTQCRQYLTTCEPLLDADGTPIGRISTDSDQGTTYHEVFVLGPDGGAVYFYVADSRGEKPGYEDPSASEPPLTPDELVALAEEAGWTAYDPAGRG